MSHLQIELLGNLRVHPAAAVRCTKSSKASELLCYLLVHRDRPRNREQLTTMLWPDGAPERTRKYLRQALWQLNAADAAQPTQPRLLTAEGALVRINPATEIDLDLARFEDAFARCGDAGGPELDRECAAALSDAIRLYRGDLLEGWCQEWCLAERERVRGMYLAMLDRLMLHDMARGEYEAAEAHALCSLRHDHARERTHRRLMELYRLTGEQSAALRQYRICRDILRDEFGVPPSRATHELYEQIRRESGDAEPSPSGTPEPGSITDLLTRLREVRGALADIERQVARDVQRVEVLLNARRATRPARR